MIEAAPLGTNREFSSGSRSNPGDDHDRIRKSRDRFDDDRMPLEAGLVGGRSVV
jgi:hypothetical protein